MKKISIIGLGLIGSSVARGLKEYYHITGYNRTLEVTTTALQTGIIDVAATTMKEAVSNADIILIATPMRYYESIINEMVKHLKPEAIITDAGSVKTSAILSICKYLPPSAEFIPAHPIAGKETSGFESGDAKLFYKKKVILTPLPKNSCKAILEVQNLWKTLGAETEEMTAAEHDKIYCAVSHIPQLLAYAYKMAIRHKKYSLNLEPQGDYSIFSRIAKSNPEIWIDVFSLNKGYIFKFLEKIFNGLVHIENFGNQVNLRKKLTGKLSKPKFTGDKKIDAATIIFPALIGNLLLFIIEDEMENNVSRQFTAADLHQSLAMLEQQIKPLQPKDFANYAGSGLRDFTIFSLLDVTSYIDAHKNEIALLKALLHRKIFEITAAIESESNNQIAEKLAEAR